MSDQVILALISLAGTIVIGVLQIVNLVVSNRMHKAVNSKMDKLLAAEKSVSKQEGIDQERTDAIERNK